MLELEAARWAEQNFGSCQLGDQRRTKRAVHYAALVAAKPEGSTPQQVEKWSDLKAIYGMLANEDVTFAALTQPHFELTRWQCRQQRHVLLLDDTTEVSFRTYPNTEQPATCIVERGKDGSFTRHGVGHVLRLAGETDADR